MLPLALLALLLPSTSALPSQPQLAFSAPPSTGLWASRIEDCPPLARRPRPTAVWDLRPDDFEVTAALGDSITAGWFAKGLRDTKEESLREYRGIAYAAGGDRNAITVPNMIRRYREGVVGASLGEHSAEICYGAICAIGPFGWDPELDQLNAALSGSLAVNLPHQARDYLVPQAEKMGLLDDRWKYVNLQIGSNDLCSLCSSPDIAIAPGSPAMFEAAVRHTLDIVRESIPNVLVNLIGVFDVSNLYNVTQNGRHPHCARSLHITGIECTCSFRDGILGEITRERMRSLTKKYNERLVEIALSYQALHDPSFGVTFQPGTIMDLPSYPIISLSPVDCFHPSLRSHRRLAIGVWNRLTLSQEEKAIPVDWRDQRVRCLQEEDRIAVHDL